MNHPIQLDLAQLLIELIPSAQRVRFLKTGTDATVAAARLARHVTGVGYRESTLEAAQAGGCIDRWTLNLAEGVAEGGRLWQPECVLPEDGWYYPPTLLTEVQPARGRLNLELVQRGRAADKPAGGAQGGADRFEPRCGS